MPLQVEDIAAEIAKQAKPQADKAAQIVRGTAQGVKEQAEPTAKVSLILVSTRLSTANCHVCMSQHSFQLC